MINDKEAIELRKKLYAVEERLRELGCEREVAYQGQGVTIAWLRANPAVFGVFVSQVHPVALTASTTLVSALKQKRPDLRTLSDLPNESLLDYVEPLYDLAESVLNRESQTRKRYSAALDQLTSLVGKLDALDKTTLEPKVDV